MESVKVLVLPDEYDESEEEDVREEGTGKEVIIITDIGFLSQINR